MQPPPLTRVSLCYTPSVPADPTLLEFQSEAILTLIASLPVFRPLFSSLSVDEISQCGDMGNAGDEEEYPISSDVAGQSAFESSSDDPPSKTGSRALSDSDYRSGGSGTYVRAYIL